LDPRRAAIAHDSRQRYAVSRAPFEDPVQACHTGFGDVEFFVAKIEYDPVYGVPTTIDTDNARGNMHSWFRQYVTDFRAIR
jgi:hypothetical protein